MSKYYDDNSAASDAGGFRLDRTKLKKHFPDGLKGTGCLMRVVWFFLDYNKKLEEHLALCDSRAAVVVSLNPLLIAAYSDDFDAVAMLKFSNDLTGVYQLQVGSRLITVNSFSPGAEGLTLAEDLVVGENAVHPHYTNVNPVIADFIVSNGAAVSARKSEIEEAEWGRCTELGLAYLQKFPGQYRDGSPYRSNRVYKLSGQ